MEYGKQIYAWVNSTSPQPSILYSSSSHSQCPEMFLYPPSPWTCHYIYPCSLLSANTFTFLVLPSNKRGGMSWDLLPLRKQTSMSSSHSGVTPPTNSPTSPSTRPQLICCSTMQVNSVAVSFSSIALTVLALIFEVHLIEVCLTQEVPREFFVRSGFSVNAVIALRMWTKPIVKC